MLVILSPIESETSEKLPDFCEIGFEGGEVVYSSISFKDEKLDEGEKLTSEILLLFNQNRGVLNWGQLFSAFSDIPRTRIRKIVTRMKANGYVKERRERASSRLLSPLILMTYSKDRNAVSKNWSGDYFID